VPDCVCCENTDFTGKNHMFALNGISFAVRSFVRWCPPFLFVLYYCTVLLCCARSVVLYTAQEGSRATGTTRGTHPRAPQGCEQRGTVLRTELTALEPHIARAPELVIT